MMKTALITEDISPVSEWLCNRLRSVFPDVDVYQCHDVNSSQQKIRELAFINIALVDLGLPDGSGIEVIQKLREKSAATYIVVTTIFDDDEHIFMSLKMGANGYLLKDLSEFSFEKRLNGLLKGDPPLSSSIARKLISFFSEPDSYGSKQDMAKPHEVLSDRETQVLQLVAKGYSRKEIAGLLDLSANTIAKYVSCIYRKLNISSKSEATIEAIKIGLVEA